jgi:2-keto-4-pentenoate hydratase
MVAEMEQAAVLLAARVDRRTIDPLSATSRLSLTEAYGIQRAGLALRVARGERRIGWKLGYTSQAMRDQMGVDAPNYGPLTDVMGCTSGVDIAERLTQPRVEPEIAVTFGADGTVTAAFACLEVVDSVYTDYRFTLEDNTADGSSAGLFVIGPQLPMDDLASIAVELAVDGVTVERGVGAAASGDPLAGVQWLGEQLAAAGERLSDGDVILTGGLTRAHSLAPGSTITAVFDGRVVEVRRSSGMR